MSGELERELAELARLSAEHLRCELEMANPYLVAVELAELEALGEGAEPANPRELAVAPEAEREAPAPAASSDDVPRRLAVVQAEAATCTRCRLHEGRTKSVFARGNPSASVMFVGEGPGYHEDQRGLPFVGKAGQLLDKMIAAMGLGADEFYICNVVKCRPPENRTPNPDEAAACSPFLRQQIELVKPDVLIALGRHAAENLGSASARWRGSWTSVDGIPMMSTYHPAFLLRSPEQKRVVWQDLQAVVAKLGRELPARR
ncbi:MAG: uracil-DNA glycosylase [Sandaracinaceae bacterium]